jgi:hypothetical protein
MPSNGCNAASPDSNGNRPAGGTVMPRVIEVVVSPQGEAVVQTKGYAGGDCLRASKFLEDALGVVADERKTAEFHLAARAEQRAHQ